MGRSLKPHFKGAEKLEGKFLKLFSKLSVEKYLLMLDFDICPSGQFLPSDNYTRVPLWA